MTSIDNLAAEIMQGLQEYADLAELLLRVIMERDIKVIDVRGQDELKNPVIGRNSEKMNFIFQ